jgi:hypothetical protein
MWDKYGLAMGGLVAPANATRDARVHGLLGDPGSLLSRLTLVSPKYTKQMQGYQLVYRNAQNQQVVDPQLVNLRQGWNLITRTIEGRARTFLVYGDGIAPTFRVDPNLKLVINAVDLPKGFKVEGQILDDSFGSTPFGKVITGLDQLQLQARSDGSKYVPLQFDVQDLAGNSTTVKLDLTIDFSTILPPTFDPITLTPRQLSETLLALLGYKVVTA